jgi:membrane fusion protein, multidrug efflux system
MATSYEVAKGAERNSPARQEDAGPGKQPSRHGWVWLLVLLLVAIGAIFAYRAHNQSQAASTAAAAHAEPPAIAVGVVTVQKRDVPFYLVGLGSVTAFNTVTVRTRIDGQLMKVYFKEGQFVREGDLLAEIDPRPYQVALEQAQGQLAKDLASQVDAKINLNRYQQLWQEGVIPRQQLDSQQATVGQFDGAIKTDQAQIDNQKLNLVYTRITSPITGRVGLRLVDAGNMVHAADTNGMLVITQVQPISIIFTLPEDNLPEVTGQLGKKELTVEAYSRDDKNKLAEGKLLTVDNQIDQTTGTVKLKATFENKDLSLWPNQFVNVRLYLSERKDATATSSAAIQRGAQGTFVYVVGADSKAQIRQVQVDFIEGNLAVIRQGLTPGEQVVVDGQDKIQPGAKVNAKPSPTNQIAAPTS